MWYNINNQNQSFLNGAHMKTTYKNFLHFNDADNWVNIYKDYFPSNNDTDKDFLKALYYYTGNANTLVNRALRYDMSILEGDFMQPIFQKMIDKLPTYHIPDNIIVYRYISKGLLIEMCPSYPPKKGMLLADKGFMSTTLVKESITNYRHSNSSLKILLEISVPAGTKGTYIGRINSLFEHEILLAPNTQLRINYKIPFYNRYFQCTVVN